MNKIASLLCFSFVFLFSNEPTLAMLESITTNTQQIFILSQNRYKCNAYGVLGVENLLKSTQLNAACKTKIESFYANNPQAKVFAHTKLKLYQKYHLEFKENECLLFASGEITLSELLLKEGLALLAPLFEDKEYKKYYKDAEAVARFEKRGLWKDDAIRDCAAELYKK
jgi:hypothetical protein